MARDSCCCSCGPGTRLVVWVFWTINLLVSAVYLGISMVTFHNVQGGVRYLLDFQNRDAYKSSLLAACLLGFLIVLFWVIFSFCVLISRFFSNLPFGYGVMLGCCSHTGFFMLLSGLVLQTHEVMAEAFESNRIWNKKDLQTFQATYVFSYVLCGTYLFMFLILLLTKGTMTEQVERSASYAVKPPPQASAAEAPAPMGIAPGVPQDAGYAGGGWGANYRGGNV